MGETARNEALKRRVRELEAERDEARVRAEIWRDVARTANREPWSEVYRLPWEAPE